jgi:hypothetical protein
MANDRVLLSSALALLPTLMTLRAPVAEPFLFGPSSAAFAAGTGHIMGQKATTR